MRFDLSSAENVAWRELNKASVWSVERAEGEDFGTVVLVDPGQAERHKCEFLQVLHRVLILGQTDFASKQGNDRRRLKELLRWLGGDGNPAPDRAVDWLKIAIERYPIRLFVAVDRDDWKGTENSPSPLEPDFWYEQSPKWMRADSRSSRSAGTGDPTPTAGANQDLWNVPDPGSWRGPDWLRFFGQRICFLDRSELERLLFEPSQLRAVFPGMAPSDTPGRLIPVWLRLRWAAHLATRWRGLGAAGYGSLTTSISIAATDTAHRPLTLPECLFRPQTPQTTSERPTGNLFSDGISLTLLSKDQMKSLGLPNGFAAQFAWEQAGRSCLAAWRLHQPLIVRTSSGAWKSDLMSPKHLQRYGFLFSRDISGALVSHPTILDLVGSQPAVRTLMALADLFEEAFVRVAICDERVLDWYSRLGPQQAGGLVQSRVFPAFWEDPGRYSQPRQAVHGLTFEVTAGSLRPALVARVTEQSPSWAAFRAVALSSDHCPVKADTLLVHQGILDKWRPNGQLTREILQLKDHIPIVVATSGRGKPDRVPPGVRFLPFSGIQTCLMGDRVDKLTLIREVMAAGGEC